MASLSIKAVQDHVKPERSALVYRYAFDTRVREANKSVGEFVKSLKHLASKCQFRDDIRNDRLRDRLIAGIRNDRILCSLLGEQLSDLTFDKAVQRCVAIEQASKDIECHTEGPSTNFGANQAERETPRPGCNACRMRLPTDVTAITKPDTAASKPTPVSVARNKKQGHIQSANRTRNKPVQMKQKEERKETKPERETPDGCESNGCGKHWTH